MRRLRLLAAVVLAPLAILTTAIVVLVSRLLGVKQTKDRTPQEVASYLRNFIEDTGQPWDWDDFESVPLTDPTLEAIRQEAVMAGPPRADTEKLTLLLGKVEELIARPVS